MGKEGQNVPGMNDEWIGAIRDRYVELYEILLGEKFMPQELSEDETEQRIIKTLELLP